MTEAWAIADTVALKNVLGTNYADADLGLPTELVGNPAIAESHLNPKRILSDVQAAVSGRRRGRRVKPGTAIIPPGLGDAVDLDRLRRLPSYASFEADLEVAVRRVLGAPM